MQEISSDVIRGYNDTIILFFLREEPSYGYEISKNIKAMSENKYLIKETTLYYDHKVAKNTLNGVTLVKLGLTED